MTQKLAPVGIVPSFEGYSLPPAFMSDGCTHCRENWFGVSITHHCFLHDFQRRYATCSVADADARLKRGIICEANAARARGEIADWEWLFLHALAAKVWLAVKIMRPWFSATQPLPTEWAAYAEPHL